MQRFLSVLVISVVTTQVQSSLVYLKNYEQRQRRILRGKFATITSPVRLVSEDYFYKDESKKSENNGNSQDKRHKDQNKNSKNRVRRNSEPEGSSSANEENGSLEEEEPLALKLDLNDIINATDDVILNLLPNYKLTAQFFTIEYSSDKIKENVKE